MFLNSHWSWLQRLYTLAALAYTSYNVMQCIFALHFTRSNIETARFFIRLTYHFPYVNVAASCSLAAVGVTMVRLLVVLPQTVRYVCCSYYPATHKWPVRKMSLLLTLQTSRVDLNLRVRSARLCNGGHVM